MREVSRKVSRLLNSVDSNWRPPSVVIVDGAPYRETQPATNAFAMVSVLMSGRGKASGHRAKRSMRVGRLMFPFDGGYGPKISMCTLSNFSDVGVNELKGALVCR